MKDTLVYDLIKKETRRQKEGIELIPSENYASAHVRKPLASVFVNKYSEGYPLKRYYGGNEFVDELEMLANERAQKLFGVPFVNVQPYSGSPANLAIMMATVKPGDTIMGQTLTSGGHLTHGHSVSSSGIFFKSIQYTAKKKPSGKYNDLFDYAEIMKLAKQHKPKLIWVGTSAYPLIIQYQEFAKIADAVGAYLVADMSHITGLVVAGVHPSPVPYVDIIMTTTHKTFRGPRGAMIMVTEKGLKKDADLPDKINKAVFPGLQGGPHDNQTAGIAVALYEASRPSFKAYGKQVVENARVLADTLISHNISIVGGRTENHLILVDLIPQLGVGGGIFAEKALDVVGLTMNKNTIPEDPSSPFYPSGVRMGTPAATTRGMKSREMKFIGNTIAEVLEIIDDYRLPEDKKTRLECLRNFNADIKSNKELKKIHQEVKKVSVKFPLP